MSRVRGAPAPSVSADDEHVGAAEVADDMAAVDDTAAADEAVVTVVDEHDARAGLSVSGSPARAGARRDLPPAIVVENVRKRFRIYHERNDSLKVTLMRGRRAKYEEFWAVDDVSFEVYPGETFGIIGENGSGKSTLLKCMARILRPDAGRVAVTGKLSALLELGAGFHPELSGRENVYLNGSILGLSKKELSAKFDEIVTFAGLERFIDTPVKNYSSGMYVRLGFSVAINVDPDVLLVDEVLAVGDETFQRRCAEKFAEMQAAGKTIVIVSHAMGSVRAMCERLAWMNQGQLQMVGDARDVIDRYLGNVHLERLHDTDSQGTRWGNGDAVIEAIEMIDAIDRPVARVRTGEQVIVRIHYKVMGRPLEKPVLGFAVHRIDGVHVTGVNIREYGIVPDQLSGSGYFDYVIERLPLLPGTYDISAAIQDNTYATTYDWWSNGFRFEVDLGVVWETEGVLSFLGHWEHPAAGVISGSRSQ